MSPSDIAARHGRQDCYADKQVPAPPVDQRFLDDSKVAVGIWGPDRRSILRSRRLGATVGNQLTRARCTLSAPRQLGGFTVCTTSRIRTLISSDDIVSASSAARRYVLQRN